MSLTVYKKTLFYGLLLSYIEGSHGSFYSYLQQVGYEQVYRIDLRLHIR